MTQNIEILSLNEKPEYAPILAHWSYNEWYRQRDIPFDVNLKAYQQRSSSTVLPRAFVALCNSMPVGMVSLKENDLWSRKDLNPWLASLYVLSDFRHLGIGNLLVKRALSEAAALDFPHLYLFLGHNEERDLGAWYRSRGWIFHEPALDNDGLETDIYRYELNNGGK